MEQKVARPGLEKGVRPEKIYCPPKYARKTAKLTFLFKRGKKKKKARCLLNFELN